MKAISLKDPWATMVMKGEKTIETRVWQTEYRGKLLICASAAPKSEVSGNAIAIADLVDCRPMTKADEIQACCDVYPRARSWILHNVRAIKPFKVKGKLGLFEVDVEGKVYFQSRQGR